MSFKIFCRPGFYALTGIAGWLAPSTLLDWLAVSTAGTGEQMFA